MSNKPEYGKYYEIVNSKLNGENWPYHGFLAGEVVKCVYSGKNTSTFRQDGESTIRNIRNKDVKPANKNLVSIWNS